MAAPVEGHTTTDNSQTERRPAKRRRGTCPPPAVDGDVQVAQQPLASTSKATDIDDSGEVVPQDEGEANPVEPPPRDIQRLLFFCTKRVASIVFHYLTRPGHELGSSESPTAQHIAISAALDPSCIATIKGWIDKDNPAASVDITKEVTTLIVKWLQARDARLQAADAATIDIGSTDSSGSGDTSSDDEVAKIHAKKVASHFKARGTLSMTLQGLRDVAKVVLSQVSSPKYEQPAQVLQKLLKIYKHSPAVQQAFIDMFAMFTTAAGTTTEIERCFKFASRALHDNAQSSMRVQTLSFKTLIAYNASRWSQKKQKDATTEPPPWIRLQNPVNPMFGNATTAEGEPSWWQICCGDESDKTRAFDSVIVG